MDSAQGNRNVSGIAGRGRRALRKFQRATTLDSINHRGDKKERGKEKGIGVDDEKKRVERGGCGGRKEEPDENSGTCRRRSSDSHSPSSCLPPSLCSTVSCYFSGISQSPQNPKIKGKERNVPLRVLRSCFKFEILPSGRQEPPRGHFGAQLTMAAAATDTGEIPA